MHNPFSLEGKTVLVTGASSGIGRATAIECSKMGARLIITGRDAERLQKTFEQLAGDSHMQKTSDLNCDTDIDALVDVCPAVDGVFFSAGVTDTTLVKFMRREKMGDILDINLVAPTILTKKLLSKKKIKQSASLVYMSSYGAEKVEIGLGVYAASKAGLNAMVRAVAKELAGKKIRANSIMPGMVRTELINTLETFSKEDLAKDEEKYPLGYGKPEDVAYAAIYLLSDASRWITGTQIRMDGGSAL